MDGLRAFFALINGTVRITALGINFLEGVFHGFSTTLAHVAILANKISFGHLDQFQHAAEAILGVTPKISKELFLVSGSAELAAKRTEEEAESLRVLRDALDEARNAVNRFMVYALFPNTNVSIHVMWGVQKQNTVCAVGKSITNRSSRVNIGALMLVYGGGGHENAGTCQIDNARADAVLHELVGRINAVG